MADGLVGLPVYPLAFFGLGSWLGLVTVPLAVGGVGECNARSTEPSDRLCSVEVSLLWEDIGHIFGYLDGVLGGASCNCRIAHWVGVPFV